MTEIEQKALALLSEVNKEIHGNPGWYEGCNRTNASPVEALCRAIEQHEAFKQEVSGVMTYIKALYPTLPRNFNRFIIPAPKPDPLVEVMGDLGWDSDVATDYADSLRASLEARGLEIREKNDE
jgi:hypothetical protein